MTPAFWQLLLAAELPGHRARSLIREVRASPLDPVSMLLGHPIHGAAARKGQQPGWTKALESALANGIQVLDDETLAARVPHAELLPPALFAWGDLAALEETKVAIVGTRSATTYGRAVAYKFAERLASQGVTIVSGGALGIDASAHRGTLAVGGRTIAVLAGGVEGVFPTKHAGLFREIRERGCLVSQFAVGSKAKGYRFLARNQLVAAMADAVLVVEAPEKSGALTTASAAVGMGKPVMVVPANIDNLNFRGSHALIRDGATLVDHPDQVLEAIGYEPSMAPVSEYGGSPLQTAILDLLRVEPLSTDRMVEKLGKPAAEVLVEVTQLELDGKIMRMGAAFSVRN